MRELEYQHTSILGTSIPATIFLVGLCTGGARNRKAPLLSHVVCGILSIITFQLSALSPLYLNYPTHIIFKSSKILPTMFIGAVWLRKRYGSQDYLAALALVAGLILFVLADASVTPNFNLFGVGVISIALVADSLVGNWQEYLFRDFGASQNEVATYTMGFAFLISIVLGFGFGNDAEGLRETLASSTLSFVVIVFALANYLGTVFVLTMIQRFGVSTTVFTTSVCKATTMALSFILFPKPFTVQHALGALLVAAGVVINVRAQQSRPAPPAGASASVVTRTPKLTPMPPPPHAIELTPVADALSPKDSADVEEGFFLSPDRPDTATRGSWFRPTDRVVAAPSDFRVLTSIRDMFSSSSNTAPASPPLGSSTLPRVPSSGGQAASLDALAPSSSSADTAPPSPPAHRWFASDLAQRAMHWAESAMGGLGAGRAAHSSPAARFVEVPLHDPDEEGVDEGSVQGGAWSLESAGRSNARADRPVGAGGSSHRLAGSARPIPLTRSVGARLDLGWDGPGIASSDLGDGSGRAGDFRIAPADPNVHASGQTDLRGSHQRGLQGGPLDEDAVLRDRGSHAPVSSNPFLSSISD